MVMQVLLKALSTSNPSTGRTGTVFVDLSKSHAQNLLAKHELFQMVKGRDENLNEMYFSDPTTALFYKDPDLGEVLTEKECLEYDDAGILFLTEGHAISEVFEEEDQPIEHQVILDEVGVRFWSVFQDSTETFVSDHIPYGRLIDALR
jgi:hypothetical protein